MSAARRAAAFLLCLSVASACGGPRAQRACGILYTEVAFPGETTYLRLIEPDSGAEHTVLTTRDAAFSGGLAPDGGKVLYQWRDATRWGDYWIMPLDGSRPKRLLSAGEPAMTGDAAWSFDGRKAAFSARRSGGGTGACYYDYYVADVASGATVRLPVYGRAYAWSPRDHRIAILCCFSEDRGVWLIDTDTGDTKRLLAEMDMTEAGLTWSPDAKQIAVVAAGMAEYIFVVDVESGTGRALTRPDGYDYRGLRVLSWSPRGDKIAFVQGEARTAGLSDCGSCLFVVDLNTGEETKVTDEVVRVGPVWSPDGREIAFVRWSAEVPLGPICKVDVSTGQVTPLTGGGDMLDILAWRWVTFVPEQGQ